jgi:hypothetical protein
LQVSAVRPRIVVGQGFTTRRYTVDSTMRYVGGAVGFGFGAMWMTVGIGSAIACLLLAALGYGAVWLAERAQASAQAGAAAPQPVNETFEADADLPLTADELELEEISYAEPPDQPARPVTAEVDYGWPTG